MKNPIKLGVVGGRNFRDYVLLKRVLDRLKNRTNISTIVSGGAKGADSLGKRWAQENQVELIEFLPDWKTHGKKAGFIRNREIVESSTAIVAFWDGKSKGTQNTIQTAKKLNKKVLVINYCVWYVYLLLCKGNRIYCGITNDLKKRLQSHADGSGAKFTKSFPPVRLLYSEELGTKSEALKREYEIKQMSRKEKEKLINV